MQANRGSIVIVEDDVCLNRAVARLLTVAGFESLGLYSAEALLADTAAIGADCFVLDLDLPGMSGLELLQGLRSAGITRPVIFITAHDDLQRSRAARAGVSCLLKPFSGTALLHAVNAALAASDPH
jgi:FixJ family two-component response regulator